MEKTQKIVLEVGDSVRYEQWVTTKNDFDEKQLRYSLETAINDVLTERQ